MIQRLWQWLWGGRTVRVRIEMERGPDWTDGDAAALAQFLANSETGRKLERRLHWGICAGAVSREPKDDFQQGVAFGRAQLVGELLTLAQMDDAGGSADRRE